MPATKPAIGFHMVGLPNISLMPMELALIITIKYLLIFAGVNIEKRDFFARCDLIRKPRRVRINLLRKTHKDLLMQHPT